MNLDLRRVLYVDAATCIAMGLFLVLLAQPLAPLLGLPAPLLEIAGAALMPIAGFMLWTGTREGFLETGAWLVVAGNAAWVAGSLALLGWVAPTALGYAFLGGQAAVVLLLAAMEYWGLRRLPA